MVQTTFDGTVVELLYCIHCPYYGYEGVKVGKFETCPECGWAMYSDTQVKEHFLNSNMYPKLGEKYRRVHKLRAHTSAPETSR